MIFSKVMELNDILTLSSLFSGAVSPIVVGIVERMIVKPGVVEENYKDTVQSSAWALGICMQTLAKRDVTEWCQKVDLASWTRNSLSNWGWSHDVLAGLHSLSQTRSVDPSCCPARFSANFINETAIRKQGGFLWRKYTPHCKSRCYPTRALSD